MNIKFIIGHMAEISMHLKLIVHLENWAKKKNCYVALTRPESENWVGRSIFFVLFLFLYRERVEFSNIFF